MDGIIAQLRSELYKDDVILRTDPSSYVDGTDLTSMWVLSCAYTIDER
jgi:hypothetical protein